MSTVRKTQSLLEKRKFFDTKLKEQIRDVSLKIKRFEMTFQNLSSSAGRDVEWIANQKDLCNTRISQLTIELENLKKKALGVMSGESDAEIEAIYKASLDHLVEADEKKLRKEQEAAEREEADRRRGNAYSSSEYQDIRNERYLNKTMIREYGRISEIVSQLPEYISKNLDTMPCNKGYRWRGVIFYGKGPDENNGITVIFEKKPEGTIIQEATPTTFTEWFKTRDGSKNLIETHKRRVTLRKPARINTSN